MAIEPIFSGGQLPANIITTQQYQRGAADVAPLAVAQAVQISTLQRRVAEDAERATTVLPNVNETPNYDVHARVEPVPNHERRQGRFFDSRA